MHRFAELAAGRFADGVNALCWPRSLPGDFGEIVQALHATGPFSPQLASRGFYPLSGPVSPRIRGKSIELIDEERLRALQLSPAGREAADAILGDLRLLREHARGPVLNCIHGYPRDEDAGPVATDVFSWHADSAPVEADTWLCTYHGSPSEGLRNEDAVRRVDVPATRAELLKLHGGADDAGFRDFLHEHCYDLHYAARPGAVPYSFGLFNLWRIAVNWPGSPVPPCIHRAPATIPGQPRLMVIC